MTLSKNLLLLAVFLVSNLLADVKASFVQEEKRAYLQENSIAIHENQILINLGQEWVTTKALRNDTRGFYILARDLPIGFWICDWCGTANHPWNFACRQCKRAR